MKILEKYCVNIIFILLICGVHSGCEQTDMKKFETSVEQLKSYQFGNSRAALSEIEALVQQTKDDEEKRMIASRLEEMLKTDISFASKQFICRQLRLIGNEEQLPVLTELLQDDKTTDIALFAMATMPSPRVDEILRNSLEKLNGDAKIAVINVLGERRDPQSINHLSALLSETDLNIAEAAGLALGKIGSSEAAAAIKGLMDTTKQEKEIWAKYYLMCAQNMRVHGEKESAVKIFKEISELNAYGRLQSQARYNLVNAGHMDALEFVSSAIREDDYVVRQLAMRAIVENPDKNATLAFCDLLAELPAKSQKLMLIALSDRSDRAALPAVLKLTESNDKDVRITALRTISILGDETVAPMLLKKIVEADADEREAARRCLYLLKGPKVDNKILEMTSDKNIMIRIESIKSLTARNVVSATPTLLSMLRDKDVRIRIESWNGLAELGSEKDLSSMISSWIQLKNKTEIQAAEEAVVKIYRKVPIRQLSTSDMVIALNTAQHKELRISLINALGRIGDPKTLPLLQNLLKMEDPEIRKATIRALSSWPSAEPIADLRQIITTSDDETEKIIALRGFIHLIGLESNRNSGETIALYDEAMNLASRTEEKKQILAGYAKINTIEALKAVEPYLIIDELKNEAAATALKISDELIEETSDDVNREKIAEILRMIHKYSAIESIRKEASDILSKLEE